MRKERRGDIHYEERITPDIMALRELRRMPLDSGLNQHSGIYFLAHECVPNSIKVGYSIDIIVRMTNINKKQCQKAGQMITWRQAPFKVRAILYTPFPVPYPDDSAMWSMETKMHHCLRNHRFFSEWFYQDAVIERLRQWFPGHHDLIADYVNTLAVQS